MILIAKEKFGNSIKIANFVRVGNTFTISKNGEEVNYDITKDELIKIADEFYQRKEINDEQYENITGFTPSETLKSQRGTSERSQVDERGDRGIGQTEPGNGKRSNQTDEGSELRTVGKEIEPHKEESQKDHQDFVKRLDEAAKKASEKMKKGIFPK